MILSDQALPFPQVEEENYSRFGNKQVLLVKINRQQNTTTDLIRQLTHMIASEGAADTSILMRY